MACRKGSFRPANQAEAALHNRQLHQSASLLSAPLCCCAPQWLAYAFGAVGAVLILHKVLARLLQRAHERRIRARVALAEAQRKARAAEQRKARAALAAAAPATGGGAAAAAAAAAASSALLLDDEEEGYRGDRVAGTCVVCLEEAVDMVFTSCGHLCCCMGCGLGLERCPICRVKSRAIKVFKP